MGKKSISIKDFKEAAWFTHHIYLKIYFRDDFFMLIINYYIYLVTKILKYCVWVFPLTFYMALFLKEINTV